MRALIPTLALAAFAGAAVAQTPAAAPPAGPPRVPPAPGPAYALALEAAQTALATCTANGYRVAVTLVDSAGVTKVQLVGDGVGPGAVGSSARKANTTVKFKEPTAAIQAKAAADPAFAATVTADTTLFARAGAMPILGKDGQFLGAMGVGGAPGGDKDDACTAAGLAKIKDRL